MRTCMGGKEEARACESPDFCNEPFLHLLVKITPQGTDGKQCL
ncbi:hypothetical protein NXY15_13960 [Bacteroides thetaiotaomicron]|nr:hypothetical protein NXY15_13960 [Bacteroides thetaiotaomicron]